MGAATKIAAENIAELHGDYLSAANLIESLRDVIPFVLYLSALTTAEAIDHAGVERVAELESELEQVRESNDDLRGEVEAAEEQRDQYEREKYDMEQERDDAQSRLSDMVYSTRELANSYDD